MLKINQFYNHYCSNSKIDFSKILIALSISSLFTIKGGENLIVVLWVGLANNPFSFILTQRS